MADDILTQRRGDILEIILNRPDDGNGASDDMARRLTELLLGAGENARMVLLRGAGKDFCIGRASMGRPSSPTKPEALQRRRQTEVIFECYGAFRRASVPIVAVVQGRALGFGCSIAALSDITLASDAATFQIPEMSHNIMPTMVLSSLVDRLPRKAIAYLTYTSEIVSAERALMFGIASDVVPAAVLEAKVDAVCAAILRAPPPATLSVKDYLRSAMDMPIAGAVDYARNLHATINSSSEMRPKS